MHTIWFKFVGSPTSKAECADLVTARALWDSLQYAGFDMVSARP